MSFFDDRSKDDLLQLLRMFLRKREWGSAASCADHILKHCGDDFEVACGLQRSVIKLAEESARGVAEKTVALELAVHGNQSAIERVVQANELVARLDSR